MQIYSGRRLFFGGGPGMGPSDGFGSISSLSPNADKRGGHSKGILFNLQIIRKDI